MLDDTFFYDAVFLKNPSMYLEMYKCKICVI